MPSEGFAITPCLSLTTFTLVDRTAPVGPVLHGAVSSLSSSSRVRAMSKESTGPNFATAETLLPAIAQDHATGEVLMLAYMNQEAFEKTLQSGQAVYFSRSKGRLWRKGEESGHVQLVRQVLVDCDRDTILLRVEQQGPGSCHMGYKSCFFREFSEGGLKVIQERAFDPDQTYS